MNTTTLASTTRPSPAQVARLVLGLFKLRIGVLIMVTALVGLAVTPGASPSLVQVAVLALAVLGASAAAGAFNQYYEAESDRLMARTRGRAFVTGAVRRSPVWLVVMALMSKTRSARELSTLGELTIAKRAQYGTQYVMDLSGEIRDGQIEGVPLTPVRIDPCAWIETDDEAMEMASLLMQIGDVGAVRAGESRPGVGVDLAGQCLQDLAQRHRVLGHLPRVGHHGGHRTARQLEHRQIGAVPGAGDQRIHRGGDPPLGRPDLAQPGAQRRHRAVAQRGQAGDDGAAHAPAAVGEHLQQARHALLAERDEPIALLDPLALPVRQGRWARRAHVGSRGVLAFAAVLAFGVRFGAAVGRSPPRPVWRRRAGSSLRARLAWWAVAACSAVPRTMLCTAAVCLPALVARPLSTSA